MDKNKKGDGPTDRQTDRRTDRQTDKQTDRQTDRRQANSVQAAGCEMGFRRQF